MQRLLAAARPFLGSRSFYRSALSVMVPVTIQQLINNLFNMTDSLMVGSLDINGLAISAVTVANKPYLVFFGVFFGLMGAGGLMISQYYGAKDLKTCQGLFSLQMGLGLLNALLFCVLLYAFPEQTMRIFVADEYTVELGVRYLRIVCFSYIPVAVSSVCILSTRSLGQNKMTMQVSLIAMSVNVVLNYVFIFGKLGLPAMGVEGAAIGTVASRIVEMLVYIYLLWRRRMVFSTDLLAFRRLKRGVIRVYAGKAVPLICNELLWTMGLNIYFWAYARLNEAAVPAITIAEQGSQVAAVMAMGTSSAVAVLIGAELGANRLQTARESSKKLLSLVLMIGGLCALVTIGLGLVLPYAFTLSAELRRTTTEMTCILALFAPASFVFSFCFYCLRIGGDTKGAMLLDGGYMWLVPVPVSIAMALLFSQHISVTGAMFVVQFLMSIKAVIGLLLVRNGKWVRNITLDGQ